MQPNNSTAGCGEPACVIPKLSLPDVTLLYPCVGWCSDGTGASLGGRARGCDVVCQPFGPGTMPAGARFAGEKARGERRWDLDWSVTKSLGWYLVKIDCSDLPHAARPLVFRFPWLGQGRDICVWCIEYLWCNRVPYFLEDVKVCAPVFACRVMDAPPKNSSDRSVASFCSLPFLNYWLQMLPASLRSFEPPSLPRARQIVARLLKGNQISQDCFIILLLVLHTHAVVYLVEDKLYI